MVEQRTENPRVISSTLILGTSLNPLDTLRSDFLTSPRRSLSPRTISFYEGYVLRPSTFLGLDVTGGDMVRFIAALRCKDDGRSQSGSLFFML